MAKEIVAVSELAGLVGVSYSTLNRKINGEGDYLIDTEKNKLIRVTTDIHKSCKEANIKVPDYSEIILEGILISEIKNNQSLKNEDNGSDEIENLKQRIEQFDTYKLKQSNLLATVKSELEQKKREVEHTNKESRLFKNQLDSKLNELSKYQRDIIEATEKIKNLEVELEKSQKVIEQAPKWYEFETDYKKALLGVNLACMLFTVISMFKAFGYDDVYSVLFSLLSSGFFILFNAAIFLLMNSELEWKRNTAIAFGLFLSFCEGYIHFIAFKDSLNKDVFTNPNGVALGVAVLISVANWIALLLRKD